MTHPPKPSILREFDLQFWQMREALGYNIPARIAARWPHSMMNRNPHRCGLCAAKAANPQLFVKNYDEARSLSGDDDARADLVGRGFECIGWNSPDKTDPQPHPGYDVWRKRKACPCYGLVA